MNVLEELCSMRGVSGHEQIISDYVTDLFNSYCTKTYKDKSGNVIGTIDNKSDFTVLFEAHMDEIGLIIKDIDENGFIKFLSVGGINSSILPGKEVIIHGKKDIFGVIGAKPPHLMTDEEKDKKIEFENLFIDAGLTKKEISQIVTVGDVITFKGEFVKLQNNRFASKSIDNRAGIYVLVKVLERLSKQKLNVNIIAVAAVQEELGCLGAKSAVFDLSPDYAMIVDVTHGLSKYIKEFEGFSLGEGPTVAIGPNFSNKYNDELIKFCENSNINFNIEVCEGHSGTDAWPIQVSQNGIPCSLISIPLRHMHSEVELCDFSDIMSSVDLMCRWTEKVGSIC